jgi:hypothetical protein
VRLVGVTFFALAAYLTAEGIASLITAATPAPSPAGLAITAAALMVMPAVAVAKRRTGRALGSRNPGRRLGRDFVSQAAPHLLDALLRDPAAGGRLLA